MAENWKDLWLKNYRGEGETEELQNFVKGLDFGAKKGATYLPWAVVERIFKFQDGKIEVIKENGTIVETDKCLIRNEVDIETGEVTEIYANSYFVNIKATWQGQEHIERYPLQNSNGNPLLQWTQNDLNKSMQRGKVKAIAIVSGIGYKLFEDGDLQFEDKETETTKKETTEEKAKELKDKKPPKPTKPKKETAKKEETAEVKEDKVEPTENKEVEVPDDRVQIEEAIKNSFVKGGKEKQGIIRGFLDKEGTGKIQELSDDKVKELYRLIA